MSSDDSGKKKKQTDDLVDISLLNASDDGTQIDTGVTSGADPSEWDPIDIETPH